MRNAIIAAAATVAAMSSALSLAAFGGVLASAMILAAPTPIATAGICDYGAPDYDNVGCYWCEKQNGMNIEAIKMNCQDRWKTATSTPPKTAPAQAPSNPPPTQAPAPATIPVQTPATKPALVKPPTGLAASPQAIAAAKAAPATRVDPANPPPPPTHVDFKSQVQSVIKSHNTNIDVVNGLARPRHWDYVDYDAARHPILYNPLNEAMTFRYFYAGDDREVYVAAGSSVLLNVSVTGVFPFTAVGDDYLTSGSITGGSPPPVYQDVAVYVPSYNQTVQVGKVQQVGHDDSQPAGSQDTFMLDDATLAWGQATKPGDGGQITVSKTQTLPGAGPTDDGKSLVNDLVVPSHPQSDKTLWLTGALVLVTVAGLVTWVVIHRRKRSADL